MSAIDDSMIYDRVLAFMEADIGTGAAADEACPGIAWVHASASREQAAARDPKGLYAAAAAGAIARLPGAGAPFEEPHDAAWTVDTGTPVPEPTVEALVDAFLAAPARR